MATTSWLFVGAVARCAGDEGVAALADRVGSSFTVLDAVARAWLGGLRKPTTDPHRVLEALGNVTRLVVVGMEATFLDALVRKLDPSVKIATIAHSPFPVDWERVLFNYAGRLERVDLDTFQNWAGGRSALLTFAYGRQHSRTAVLPLWLRACGSDVRAQFRALVAWDILDATLEQYPRWLVEVETDSFTHVVY